ncbi:steroid receptor RNA activator 1 [Arctopsyche grandis]|uniref:steroid receptor RNA activator 1 n=1 Tax=Arctopsyche grandis TaxID=121162 RepID=UPI00406D6D2A
MSSPGKYDPGWNDPPMFTYNAEAAPAKPRNLLNKRVPFSINSTPVSTEIKPPLSQPPHVVTPQKANPNVELNPSHQETIEDNESPHDFKETIDIFKELVDSSPELGKKAIDIQKRLSIMESMWKEGKLNEEVQSKTFQIAKALRAFDTKHADDIHKSLMVDHISSVSPWMVAVKQLIFHYNAKSELLKIDVESS